MKNHIPYVRPGQRIAAEHMNRIADVASRGISGPNIMVSDVPGGQLVNVRGPLGRMQTATVFYGVNLTDPPTLINPYEVLALGFEVLDWTPAPGDDTRANYVSDIDSESLYRFVIALEPIRPGWAGRVAVAGCAYVSTDGSDNGNYVQAQAGSRVMTTALSGAAQILFHDIPNQIAFVRFPIGSEGGEGGSQWQFVWNEGADL